MKTYCKEMGEDSFNWHEFLDKKEFTSEELEDACSMSENWVTCAVGNQCACIPRDKRGEPMDERLSYLGGYFYYKIFGMRLSRKNIGVVSIEGAKEVLAQIEQRSEELIAEYNNQIQ